MAYFLRETSTSAASAYATTASAISFSGATTWEVEFTVQVNGTDWVLLSNSLLASADIVFIKATQLEFRRSAGGNLTFTLPENSTTAVRTYILRTSGSGVELLQDGVSAGTLGASTNFWNISHLFTLGTLTRHGDLYRLKITKDSVLTNDYDPSASSGTGSTLPDTVGSNDGTLVSFPTDYIQWVFYSTGSEGTASHQANAATHSASGKSTPFFTLAGTFAPNQTITLSLFNSPATPSEIRLIDSNSNLITRSLSAIGGNQYTFTLPAIPTAGNNSAGVLFGSISAELAL